MNRLEIYSGGKLSKIEHEKNVSFKNIIYFYAAAHVANFFSWHRPGLTCVRVGFRISILRIL